MINRLTRASSVFAGLALAACGGGGSGAPGGGEPVAGIDGTGIGTGAPVVAAGTVTGFGSVFVNGVRFETSNSSFVIDGEIGTEDDLDVGDVVVVYGTLDDGSETSGTATEIIFDDIVEGSIEAGSIDLVSGVVLVLGQTVVVNADTSFDDSIQPPSLEGLNDGDIIEVSGFRASDGTIQATRIEPKLAGLEFELTGVVANLDAGAFSFDINGISVDYSGALIEDFAGGQIAEGDLVEVKSSGLGGSGELIATRVEFKGDDVGGEDGDRVEIEGLITRFGGTDDFDVAGLPVTTTADTLFEGGVAADLGLDLKVEVEGELDAFGVLVATEVDIRRTSDVRVAAVVDSVDSQSDAFVVLGITVNTDDVTRIEDKSSLELEPFSVDDLVPGDYVEVRGVELPVGSREILASLVERRDLDTDTELRGVVTVETGAELEILGVMISTSGATVFRDDNDVPISATEFFDQIAVGAAYRSLARKSVTFRLVLTSWRSRTSRQMAHGPVYVVSSAQRRMPGDQ